jgi:hypothetical protein
VLRLLLALQLSTLQPALTDPLAHVHAARDAAGDDLPVELVLAIAWWETGYLPAPHTEPHHCGVMQVEPQWLPTRTPCAALRPLSAGYAAGAHFLRRWLVLSGGRWREAIRGYRCGDEGLRKDCHQEPGYDDKVLAQAERFGWTP